MPTGRAQTSVARRCQTDSGPSGSGPGRSSCRVILPGPTTAAGYATACRDFVPWRFGCMVGSKIGERATIDRAQERERLGRWRAPDTLDGGLYPVELHTALVPQWRYAPFLSRKATNRARFQFIWP
jgi:hypothetical protein